MENTAPESDLIQKIRAGDTLAFEQLFHTYCQALIRFACRFVRDVQVAENIVQDVFVRIWHNRAKLNPDSNIKAYLYKAIKNQTLQHLRHLKIEIRTEYMHNPGNPHNNPEKPLEEQQIAKAVYEAIAELPPHRRLIFTLSKYDHYTYAEIAEIQNISIKTVETQMGRALRFLRKRLAHLTTMLML